MCHHRHHCSFVIIAHICFFCYQHPAERYLVIAQNNFLMIVCVFSFFGGYPNSANKNKPNVFHSKDYHHVHDNQYLLSLAISVRTRVKTFSRCRLGDQHIQEFFRDRFMNLSNVPTSAAAPNLPFVPTWTMPGGMQIPPWMQAYRGAPQFQESAGRPPAAAPNAPPAPVPAVVLANQNAQAPAAAAAAAGEVVQDSHGFPDDRKRLHKDSKVLGMAWQVGDRRRCTSKKFRASCISVCDRGEWPMLKLRDLNQEQTDFFTIRGHRRFAQHEAGAPRQGCHQDCHEESIQEEDGKKPVPPLGIVQEAGQPCRMCDSNGLPV